MLHCSVPTEADLRERTTQVPLPHGFQVGSGDGRHLQAKRGGEERDTSLSHPTPPYLPKGPVLAACLCFPSSSWGSLFCGSNPHWVLTVLLRPRSGNILPPLLIPGDFTITCYFPLPMSVTHSLNCLGSISFTLHLLLLASRCSQQV